MANLIDFKVVIRTIFIWVGKAAHHWISWSGPINLKLQNFKLVQLFQAYANLIPLSEGNFFFVNFTWFLAKFNRFWGAKTNIIIIIQIVQLISTNIDLLLVNDLIIPYIDQNYPETQDFSVFQLDHNEWSLLSIILFEDQRFWNELMGHFVSRRILSFFRTFRVVSVCADNKWLIITHQVRYFVWIDALLRWGHLNAGFCHQAIFFNSEEVWFFGFTRLKENGPLAQQLITDLIRDFANLPIPTHLMLWWNIRKWTNTFRALLINISNHNNIWNLLWFGRYGTRTLWTRALFIFMDCWTELWPVLWGFQCLLLAVFVFEVDLNIQEAYELLVVSDDIPNLFRKHKTMRIKLFVTFKQLLNLWYICLRALR